MKCKDSAKFFIVLCLSLFFVPLVYLLCGYSESVLVIFVILLFVFVSVYLSEFDPLDPRVWVLIFGSLYSFSFYVLHLAGEERAEYFGTGVFLGFLFIVSALISMWALAVLSPQKELAFSSLNIRVPRAVILGFIVVFLILLVYITLNAVLSWGVGVSDKRSLKSYGVALPFANTALNWFFMIYVILLWFSWPMYKRRGFLIFLVFVIVLFIWGATGERDVLLKCFLVTVFVALYNGSVSKRFLYVSGFVVLIILPITKDLGVLLMSDAIEFRRSQDIFIWVLKLEWKSAGENLDNLLMRQGLYSSDGFVRFFSDVARGVIPGDLFSGMSTRDWYYEEYAPLVTGRTSTGVGFTYIGGWYVYLGSVGVMFGGIVFGVVSWLFYRISIKNVIMNSAYIVYVPIAIWSLRVDFSGFLSALTKQSLLPALIIAFMILLLKKVYGRRRFSSSI